MARAPNDLQFSSCEGEARARVQGLGFRGLGF